MAANGSKDAARHLDELIGDVSTPNIGTIYNLLARGFAGIGNEALRKTHCWLTEGMSEESSFHFLANEDIWTFMTSHDVRRLVGEPSLHELRHVIYYLLAESRYRHLNDDESHPSYPHPLTVRIVEDRRLRNRFYQRYYGKQGIICDLIYRDSPEVYFSDYASAFRAFDLDELAALTEFLRAPSSAHLKAMLAAYDRLLPSSQSAFIELIWQWHRLLQDIAERLQSAEGSDIVLAHFDDACIEAYLQEERQLIEWIDRNDIVAIILAKNWKQIHFPNTLSVSSEQIRRILNSAQDEHITPRFISFLYNATYKWRDVTLELRWFALNHFPLFFRTGDGTRLAIKLLQETPLRDLISHPIVCPDEIHYGWIYHHINQLIADALLERVDQLVDLGNEYLSMYALLPLLFKLASHMLLTRIPAKKLVHYLHLIEETGNQAARLGCLPRLLAGPICDDHRQIIWDTLLALTSHYLSFLRISMESFSLDGKLLVYQAAKDMEAKDQQHYTFTYELADDIFDHLEGHPVEQNELLELPRSAHQDRNLD